ncbi:DNA repair protein [Lentinula edodes]|uniref:Rolly protein n=1 Tax=Lentinula edodes TaxID=5353 RepID=A0A1Q3E5M0_LENED|nr:DNA repair protein [Lentinula edodes]KAH7869623.1 DNA repair protein [Lentinula edodes]KAJ3890345.1 DNA repair protein [Lentinula edodes]KAJ3907165.1 DNA repair protein [Lentinula edodes]GAW02540.1 rolly protein [Lentinula edodes]
MHARVSQQIQEARITQLEAEVNRLQQELGQDEDAEKIVNKHIKLLHRYNEAKDAAQMLIGRLANLKETTVRQIHNDLDLPIGD